MRRSPWSLLACVVMLAAAGAPAAPRTSGCAGPTRSYPGTGAACVARDGGFLVRSSAGTWLRTHGPDAKPPLRPSAKAKPGPAALSVATSAQCADPLLHHHVEIYYAHLAGTPDRTAQQTAELRSQFASVDGDWLDTQSTAKGGPNKHLWVACDPSGQPTIGTVHLRMTPANLSWKGIVNDMEYAGHLHPLTHYWVFVDGATFMPYGGQSNVGGETTSDLAGPANPNSTGPAYSVNYGYTGSNGSFTFAHENGHAMGAVQQSAPHSTGAFHCTDGYDLMCYDDGGPKGSSYSSTRCPAAYVFDCGGDDYFNPKPAPGSYLAGHWNIGDPFNPWIKTG